MENSGLRWKFVFRVGGFILLLESVFMFLSTGVAYFLESPDANAFVFSGLITLATGLALILPTGIRKEIKFIGKREGYLSVFVSWTLFALFASLPFFISREIPSFTNAFFESTSGITTTGASILTDVDSMPKGLLFWRSLIQWLGGMGIIVFSLALMPLLGGGAALLFDAESSGLTAEKFRPRFSQIAKRLWGIYLLLTVVLTGLLVLGPMNWFDAVCHAFTTVSTGGFSTRQLSIAYWDSAYLETVLTVFMIIGAINFSLLYFLIKGKIRRLFNDEELRWYLGIIVFASALVAFSLSKDGMFSDVGTSVRTAVFQVVSLFTTTGYSTEDFTQWGPFYWIVFLILMLICGCAGSTSGGLKTVRAVILVKNSFAEFGRLLHPQAIIPIRLNGKAVSFGIVQQLLAFAFLYIFIIIFSWGIFCLAGMPFNEALGASVSGLSNVGPGFGANGPAGSFVEISVFAKWYMSFLMIVGRLEIFTVLILFTSAFWKK